MAMKIIFAFTLLLSFQAIAASASLLYSTGPFKGQDLIENPSHFGYDEICYKGDPIKARSILFEKMENDTELAGVFAKYLPADKSIVYGYTSTKCTDEMANDPSDCRSVKLAKKCF